MKIRYEFVARSIAGEHFLVPIGEAARQFSGMFAMNELGAFLWEATLGRLLRPIFARFWGFLWWIVGVPWGFLKKILKKLRNFRKKYLHLEKNRVQ